ncbi:hypothetical protein [Aurantiacibacter gangjinensis]|uniref:Uncharacterized protein n=1 Tax=Aurantiacibacter gangjinensis TaxID=502682 RepID=A0A0G9MPI3_9SPHN|nr:hypothetical protein [Aurantiacibacter gangjinensis]APE28394.1 hypothetical protein BMF35_a1565 [Aurantiacibacter gangjinensis]KLE32621.1 hypothetical protein AAW01_00700 [Aurantiacibacter gangjinensis]
MTPQDFARASWQANAPESALPPIAELRRRADEFRRQIKWRNAIEYAAGALVAAGCIAIIALIPLAVMKAAAALLLAGIATVLWQLHRRGAPLTPASDGGAVSVLEYQRRELVRQRDAIDNVLWWYLLPLVPGMLAFLAVPWLATPMADWQAPPLADWPAFAFPIVVFVGVYALNKWGARRLQREIDAIDALREG